MDDPDAAPDLGLAGLSPEFQAMLGGMAGHTASFAKILVRPLGCFVTVAGYRFWCVFEMEGLHRVTWENAFICDCIVVRQQVGGIVSASYHNNSHHCWFFSYFFGGCQLCLMSESIFWVSVRLLFGRSGVFLKSFPTWWKKPLCGRLFLSSSMCFLWMNRLRYIVTMYSICIYCIYIYIDIHTWYSNT